MHRWKDAVEVAMIAFFSLLALAALIFLLCFLLR